MSAVTPPGELLSQPQSLSNTLDRATRVDVGSPELSRTVTRISDHIRDVGSYLGLPDADRGMASIAEGLVDLVNNRQVLTDYVRDNSQVHGLQVLKSPMIDKDAAVAANFVADMIEQRIAHSSQNSKDIPYNVGVQTLSVDSRGGSKQRIYFGQKDSTQVVTYTRDSSNPALIKYEKRSDVPPVRGSSSYSAYGDAPTYQGTS